MTTPGDTPRVVRKMPGPYLTRACLQEGASFRWLETLTRDPTPYLGEQDLPTLIEITRDLDQHVSLPVLAGASSALWGPVSTPRLLCDDLFERPSDRASTLVWTMKELGTLLSLLHTTEVPRNSLPLRIEPAWLQLDRDAQTGIAGALGALPLEECPHLAASASAAPPPTPKAFVHGRFSTGLVVSGEVFQVMGWREAGVGDPCTDLAYMVSEVIEAAAVTDAPPELMRSFVAAFLEGYRDARTERTVSDLPQLTAQRVLQHYAQGTWAFGVNPQIRQTLRSAEAAWQHLRPALEVAA